MIIQSSNNPLVIYFDDNMEEVEEIRVTLWKEEEQLKEWGKEDLEIDEKKITCPLTQEETKDFPKCTATLEIKWLNDENKTVFSERVNIKITDRYDKEVMGSD